MEEKIDKKIDSYEFHYIVKKIVDRIVLFYIDQTNVLKYIGDMVYINNQAIESKVKIFNGSIPLTLPNGKFLANMLGGEGITSYTFNTLFSIPITIKILNLIKSQNNDGKKYILKNTIIINTPEEVKFIIIQTPEKLRKLLNLPEYIFPINIKESNIVLFPEKTTCREKLSKGVDPQAIQYIKNISIDISNIILDNLENELLSSLDEYQFHIYCYSHIWSK